MKLCSDCYTVFIQPDCNIVANGVAIPSGGITPGTYSAWMSDSFGNFYTQSITVGANNFGLTTIFATLIPTQSTMPYRLWVSTSTSENTEENFTISGITYSCFELVFSCVTPATVCEKCYEMTLDECSSSLIIDVGLNIVTPYVAWIQDSFGNRFVLPCAASTPESYITVDLTGFGTYDVESGVTTPSGLTFSKVSSIYELTFSTRSDSNTRESLTINGTTYPCVLLKFISIE